MTEPNLIELKYTEDSKSVKPGKILKCLAYPQIVEYDDLTLGRWWSDAK